MLLQNLMLGDSSEEVVASSGSFMEHPMVQVLLDSWWVFLPLFLMSIYAVYIFVERTQTIGKANKNAEMIAENVKKHVLSGNLDEAKKYCSQVDTPVSRMLGKGLERIGSPLKTIEGAIENRGRIEVNNLERNLSSLATISGAAPMLGFLGTVMGMISAFQEIAAKEGQAVSPSDLAGGINEAMVTTAAGLIVGIIAYVAYNFLSGRVQRILHGMEYSSVEFLDLLQESR